MRVSYRQRADGRAHPAYLATHVSTVAEPSSFGNAQATRNESTVTAETARSKGAEGARKAQAESSVKVSRDPCFIMRGREPAPTNGTSVVVDTIAPPSRRVAPVSRSRRTACSWRQGAEKGNQKAGASQSSSPRPTPSQVRRWVQPSPRAIAGSRTLA